MRLLTGLLAIVSLPDMAFDFSAEFGVEGRRFLEEGAYDHQVDDEYALSWKPEFVWEGDSSEFVFTPYFRKDFQDPDRSHSDVREAIWKTWSGPLELHVGVSKVFWGVTESINLADVINQTDQVESPDGDEKLGQPMIRGIWLSESWGTFDAFILPGFRERTFPGEPGRYRLPVPFIDAEYQASEEDKHVDYSMRWSNYYELFGAPLDISFSLFHGTSRDPIYIVQETEFSEDLIVPTGIIPYYAQMNQAAMTLQYSLEGWLLKAEMRHRDILDDEFEDEDADAAVTGFEYTIVGPLGLDFDLGLLMEYQYDSRGKESLAQSQNDMFYAARIAFYDMDSSEILMGMTQDLDFPGSRLYSIEGNTRLNSFTTISVRALVFVANPDDEVMDFIKKDDTLQAGLTFYF